MILPRGRPLSNPARKQRDEKLFTLFLEVLPSHGSIEFIRKHDMAGCYRPEALDGLRSFVHEWIDAEHEFHNTKLDSKRKRLLKLVNEYFDILGQNAFRQPNGWHAIPEEWRVTRPEHYQATVTALHRLADEVVEVHQEIVRLGRKKFSVVE